MGKLNIGKTPITNSKSPSGNFIPNWLFPLLVLLQFCFQFLLIKGVKSNFALLTVFFWYWCYYPHRLRDFLSPVCGTILLQLFNFQLHTQHLLCHLMNTLTHSLSFTQLGFYGFVSQLVGLVIVFKTSISSETGKLLFLSILLI